MSVEDDGVGGGKGGGGLAKDTESAFDQSKIEAISSLKYLHQGRWS